MKYITLVQKEKGTGGRSGDKLKTFFSIYILSFFIKDSVAVPHPTWNSTKQLIINFDNFAKKQGLNYNEINKHFCKNFHTKILNIEASHGYKAMKFESLQEIIKKINSLTSDSLVKIHDAFRIYPFQLTDWYNQGLIKENLFLEKFIPLLRKSYYGTRIKKQKHQLAIHIRRGDIAPGGNNHNKEIYWPLEYFCKQIDLFEKMHQDIPIKVFSEKGNSNDLLYLKKYSNLQLNLGNFNELEDHVHEMVSSSFFMPCNSGLSSLISYISEGQMIMPKNKRIKHFHSEHIW